MAPSRRSRRIQDTTTLPSDLDTTTAVITHLPFAPGSSHTRNRKEGHIPRPPNAFMVFRSWLWNTDNLKSIERDNRNVSRIAGRYWNELPEAERTPFRIMAEQAKARHAQLYPQYRYSPASQKKPKVTQRRSQRALQMENEKCDRVVNMLLHARPSPNPLDGEAQQQQQGSRKRSSVGPFPPQPRVKKPKVFQPPISDPCLPPLPVLPPLDLPSEVTPTPGPAMCTPEMACPSFDDFVPTNEIPHLSLDAFNDPLIKPIEDDDLSALFPTHMTPAAHTIFSGVKPEATSFVDSCMFGTYSADQLPPLPLPFTNFDMDPFASLDPVLAPLGSPIFSNPFEPSIPTAEHSALLDTLDQLFGHPTSPLGTTFFPTENW